MSGRHSSGAGEGLGVCATAAAASSSVIIKAKDDLNFIGI
jgi:hypothetical protein